VIASPIVKGAIGAWSKCINNYCDVWQVLSCRLPSTLMPPLFRKNLFVQSNCVKYIYSMHLNFEMVAQKKYLLCSPKFDGRKHSNDSVTVLIGLGIVVSLD